MPSILTRSRAVLVVTGMVLLTAGVVAGAAVGTLIRPVATGQPVILGASNHAGENATRIFATSGGGAIWANQRGAGTAVRGDSQKGDGGVLITRHRNKSGLEAENTADTGGSGAGVTAKGNLNPGVRATSQSVAVIAEGQDLAVYAQGSSIITGDLTIQGSCTGCLATAFAVNVSQQPLQKGDAVTILGTITDDAGTILLQVAAAQAGDRVLGVVSGAVTPETVKLDPEGDVATYRSVDEPAPPQGTLRVVLGGVIDFAAADASGGEIQPGDYLVAGSTAGVLVKAQEPTASGAVGYALGGLSDGRVAVFVSPR